MNRFPPPSELLPHAGPAVLIDEILSDTDSVVRASAHITPQHPFFVAGHGVPTWVGIEMMAQAIAAHAGLSGQREGREPRQGMLLGTRRYQASTSWFADGDTLTITAQTAFGHEGGMAACDCRIENAAGLLAEATIIIVEGEIA